MVITATPVRLNNEISSMQGHEGAMKPTVPEVIPLMYAVYDRNHAGCCAHIVTDDDNTEDHHAEWCLQEALKHKHTVCIALCEALVQMSPTQRHQLYRTPRPPVISERIRAGMHWNKTHGH